MEQKGEVSSNTKRVKAMERKAAEQPYTADPNYQLFDEVPKEDH